MNLIKLKLIFSVLITSCICLSSSVKSQSSTWGQIHNIFQASCAGSSCHDGGANPLVLIGTEADVYNNLMNVDPTNPVALARGLKLVKPGHPHYSFLLKKVNNGLDPDNDPKTAEGVTMPLYSTPLNNDEIDLINAWIVQGAPETGIVADTQLIQDYHNGMGKAQMDPPAAPDSSEGFQIHLSGFIIPPDGEEEYRLKYELPNISDSMEIYRLESYINIESHHFIIYKFDNASAAASIDDGARLVDFSEAFTPNTTMVAAWQNSYDIVLPENTAYFWEPNPVLDLNLHLRNYDQDSILKGDVYTNVYIRPKQPETIEMYSDLVLYATTPLALLPCGINNFCIPADGQDHTFSGTIKGHGGSPSPFSGELNHATASDSIYLWFLSSHTHKFGTDYDIFLRNSDGSKGDQIYEGFYNYDYTFNQGYYDYEDPAVRYFQHGSKVIHGNDGFIHEATFNNDSTVDVGFGLTTNDEMMLAFFQYTTVRPPVTTNPTSLDLVIHNSSIDVVIVPNPFTTQTHIAIKTGLKEQLGAEKRIVLYDLLGKKAISQQFPENQNDLTLERGSLTPGVYLYRILVEGQLIKNGKVIIQ